MAPMNETSKLVNYYISTDLHTSPMGLRIYWEEHPVKSFLVLSQNRRPITMLY